MTRQITKFMSVVVVLILCSAGVMAQTWDSELAEEAISLLSADDSYAAAILQDGVLHPVANAEIPLRPAAFGIVLVFHGPGDVLMNASRDPRLYIGVRKGRGFNETLENPEMFMGMAEGWFNDEQTLMISENSPHYLYFADIDNHRFDFVHSYPGSLIGHRQVEYLLDLDGLWPNGSGTIRPDQLSEPIYLSFFSTFYENGQQIERQFSAAKLLFR